jgi:hypothetical protein
MKKDMRSHRLNTDGTRRGREERLVSGTGWRGRQPERPGRACSPEGTLRLRFRVAKNRVCSHLFGFVRHCSGFWEFFYFVYRRYLNWLIVES